MLSTASSTVANPLTSNVVSGVTQVDGGAPVADTIEAKLQHIQNYPYFVGLLNRDGTVPQPTVSNIQKDLYQMIGTLHPGDTNIVRQFNLDLRDAGTSHHILPDQAATLNRDFGAVLTSAGGDPALVADLQRQMDSLTQFATTQANSSIVARNNYSTALQLALGTGRPLISPGKPRLAPGDRAGTNANKLDVTQNATPSLSGTYAAGTSIQIVDANNTVFGSGLVDKSGNYKIKFANPLPNGTYTVRVRAEDAGYFSPASKTYTFVVKAKAPKVSTTTGTSHA